MCGGVPRCLLTSPMLPSQTVPSLAPRQHLRIKIDHPAILFSFPAVPTEGEPRQEEQQMEQEQRGGKEGWGTRQGRRSRAKEAP